LQNNNSKAAERVRRFDVNAVAQSYLESLGNNNNGNGKWLSNLPSLSVLKETPAPDHMQGTAKATGTSGT